MRRIVVSLLLMFGSILATAAKVLPMTFAHDGATGNLTGVGQAYYALTDHLGSYTRLYSFHLGSHVFISWFWSTSSWHEQYISTSINNRSRSCYVWIDGR